MPTRGREAAHDRANPRRTVPLGELCRWTNCAAGRTVPRGEVHELANGAFPGHRTAGITRLAASASRELTWSPIDGLCLHERRISLVMLPNQTYLIGWTTMEPEWSR